MALVTENNVDDAEMLSQLLDNVAGEISPVLAAYDKKKCYRVIDHHRAMAVIVPPKGAIMMPSHLNSSSVLIQPFMKAAEAKLWL